MNPALLALFILRIVGSALLVFLASSLLFIKASPPSAKSHIVPIVVRVLTPRRTLIVSLLALAAFTYFIDAIVVIVFAILNRKWQGAEEQWQGILPSDFLGIVAFLTVAILGNVKEAQGKEVWKRNRVKAFAIAACALDIALVLLMVTNIDFRKQGPSIPEKRRGLSISDFSHLVISLIRLLFSIPLLTALCFPRHIYVNTYESPNSGEASSSNLITHNDNQSQYGTFTPAVTLPPSPNAVNQVLPKKPDAKQEIALDPTWSEMLGRLKRITPYLWHKNSRPLQFVVLCCILILVLGRFVNLALPFTFGKLVAIFEKYASSAPKNVPKPNPWPYLGFYVVLRFLQGSGGLAALRDSLWAPVMQYSDRGMSQLTFNHLLNLSLSFHTRRKTGEILRILDRGAAINHILELILFNILPTLLDMTVALVVFLLYFKWSLALVILVVMIAYITASITLTTWRTKIRRKMNDKDVITRGIHTDCLLNYETVKYFGGEDHEAERYAGAIRDYQKYEYQVMISLNLLNLVQTAIITLGLLAGSAIVANDVVNQVKDPADFVIFITYLAQLYGPLNNLGYVYRSINQSLVDTERLFKLLDEPTDVNDKPNAAELQVHEGEIEFENVTFSYDGRTDALKGVTFKVPKGSKVALVGESGSGKSTILRLLYRFYDLKEGQGRILVDGNDIRDVTQASLRKSVGVVPQDSVLFNTSIAYNIGYGKFGAPLEEIEEAAKAAQMHDRILSFPDGYETKVGERGVRLSGGEKQRVAIARTLLKNPPILLLDEATSALDTSTERDIQKALQNLIQGRSSLSIAHRLSTIASADLILVLSDGQIVEQGTHKELLKMEGIFAKMWADQVNADRRAQSMGSVKESGLGLLIGDVSATEVMTGYEVEPIMETEEVETHAPEETGVSTDAILNTGTLVDEPEGASIRAPTTVPDTIERASVAQASVVQEPREVVEEQEAEIVAEDAKKDAAGEEGAEDASTAPKSSGDAVVEEPKEEKINDSTIPDDSTGGAHDSSGEPSAPPTNSAAAGPITFPSGGDDAASSKPASIAATPSGGITFSPEVNSPPSRSGTPDPDAPSRRKRISSQNFQRLAKKITMVRRNSSVNSFDADASTSSLESPTGSKPRMSKLRRKSTAPPPAPGSK